MELKGWRGAHGQRDVQGDVGGRQDESHYREESREKVEVELRKGQGDRRMTDGEGRGFQEKREG